MASFLNVLKISLRRKKHKTQGNIEKREQSAEKDILQLSDKSDKVDREVQEEIPRANIKWQKAKASDNSHSEEIS
ncbi:hypothetical protein A4H02_07845 [Fervidobacterium thailandense]|uniref:Uncharacterized protein n=1 Tax=Fervidobacterium thailandense TaxID=1008305 RepID=A0A1E3G1F7_9BACT|nr:hypothetical protein A4H02_07845 [Fervidobacterium thailandense]